MKKFRRFFLLQITLLLACAIFAPATAVFAQSVTVSGRVIDEAKHAIIGGNVIVKGTMIGASTDMNGNYTITVPSSSSVLVFSYMGYDNTEVAVGAKTKIDVALKPADDGIAVDAVVVTTSFGQTVDLSDLPGTTTVFNTEALTAAPVSDPSNLIGGSPGIVTTQTTGEPGADSASISIRGGGDPLVLIDGVERPMSSIDANEIESMIVLKDAASTAVYGVRGAEGVIIITTRRGTSGKPSISLTSTFGLQQPTSFVTQTDSYNYALFWNQKNANDGTVGNDFSAEAIEAYRTGSDPIMYPNSNWGDMVFNNVFFQTQNNINISGGSDKLQYFVSMGYLFKDGILKQDGTLPYNNNYQYERYNFRSNLNYKLTDKTEIKFNVGGSVGETQQPGVIEGVTNPWTITNVWSTPLAGPGLIDGIRTLVPSTSVPGGVNVSRDGYFAFYGYGYKNFYDVSLNMDAEITHDFSNLVKGLKVSAKGSYDNRFRLNKDRTSTTSGIESQTVYYASMLDNPDNLDITDPYYDKTYKYVPSGSYVPLGYSETYQYDRNWSMEFKANWVDSFGKDDDHTVGVLAVYNQQKNYYPTYSGSAMLYSYIPRSYAGFAGRVTYDFRKKYLAEVSMGYNGSENFAPGSSRYGLFPAASLSWVVSEESFMKNSDGSYGFISYLKLRGSLGLVGNDAGTSSRFMYMDSIWEDSEENYYFGQQNSEGLDIYYLGTPGNSDVTWETAIKYNLGFDMRMLRNRLSTNFDVFYEYRSDILLTPNSTPSIIATSLPDMNIGEISNKGFEVAVTWKDEVLKDANNRNGLIYSVTGNVSFARNKIIEMDEVMSQYSYQNQTGGASGRYTNLYEYIRLYTYDDFDVVDGQYVLKSDLPQPYVNVYPGDAMYADLNGDGVVDNDDKSVMGFSTTPELSFGLSGTLSYRGWDFSMQWNGATNVNRMMEVEYRIPYTNAGGRGLLTYFVEDCWSPSNLDGTLPRASDTSKTWNSEDSSLWLRDATYFRLKTIGIGYTFSKNNCARLEKAGIGSVGVRLTGYNLLTFSPLDFQDPEALASNNGAYPLVKSYDLGISLKF